MSLPEGRGTVRFVRTKHFFGYTRLGDLVIAQPEKLFLDCLLFPGYCGGGQEILESFEKASPEIDAALMVEYARMTESRTLASRAGYMLDRAGMKFKEGPLLDQASTSYVPFDPGAKRSSRDPKWNIIEMEE